MSNEMAIELPSVLNPFPEILVRPSQLVISPYQVRKQARNAEYLEELVASIAKEGVMHNLTVHEMPKKKGIQLYGVIAGGRRHAAIQILVSRGLIDDARDPVRVNLAPVERALALSLAENIHREQLHPADEFEGFKRMIEGGESIEDTAAAFGVTPLVVKRRLRLANVEPSFLALFRAGELDMAQLMALASTVNHDLQKEVWEAAQHSWQRTAHSLRAAIVGERIDASKNPLALFVGTESYIKAGGAIERDLFSQNGESGIIADGLLLQQLATEALQTHVEAIRSEGWGWILASTSFDHAERSTYRDAPQTRREPNEEESRRLEQLNSERSAFWDKQDDDELTDEESARFDVVENQIEDIEDGLFSFTPDVMKNAGVVVTINETGSLKILRGLVRKEDIKALVRDSATASENPGKQTAEFSEKLYQRLTAHQSLALQSRLATNPKVAIALLTAQFVGRVFDYHGLHSYGLDAHIRPANLESHADNLEENPAHNELEDVRAGWVAKLPKKQKDVLPWLLKQEINDLLELLAFCSAISLNFVRNSDTPCMERDLLVTVLDVDMADFWKPSAGNFLTHLNKEKILSTVKEAVPGANLQNLQDLKKGPMIEAVSALLASTRWLPKFMRRKSQKMKGSK